MAGERGHLVDEEEFRRLQRDYTDATEQFAAMSEVLTALGRSASDPDAVLGSVVESARRLCRCEAAAAYLIDGDHFALATSVGLSTEFVRRIVEHPFKIDRATLLGLLLGPTGNLRAPTLRKGRTLIVGFEEETYEKLLK